MSARNSTYDVVIIGGGMVGATSALALGQAGIKVALVEKSSPLNRVPKQHRVRVSAITLASVNILQAVGAWPLIAKMRANPFTEMHVWDATGTGSIHFDCADVGQPVMGYIVENDIVVAGLWRALRQSEEVTTYCPAEVQNIRQSADMATVMLKDGPALKGSLLVGAEGVKSLVRDFAGIELKVSDYRQQAIVANVRTEYSHEDTAWQRFLPTGPVAFLPLDEHLCSVVWTNDTDTAEQIMGYDEDEFSKALYAAIDGRLGRIEWVSERAAFPLLKRHAGQYVRPGIALLGDAAHTIHPLAGQGVNLGLADAAALAEVVAEARAAQRPIGDLSVLRRYERWRKGENLLMQNSMSAFKNLFGNNDPLLSSLRNIGLTATDHLAPVKNTLNQFAMGLKGDLSGLARRH